MVDWAAVRALLEQIITECLAQPAPNQREETWREDMVRAASDMLIVLLRKPPKRKK